MLTLAAMNWRGILIVAVMTGTAASAREWRSVDGSRTVEAEFAGLKEGKLLLKTRDGKATVFPANIFSNEDQQFAKQAQVTLETAVKAGALNLQVDQVLQEGTLCRVITEVLGQKGIWTASGSPFLMLSSADIATERGTNVLARTLYHAGSRTLQALDGTQSLIQAYSLSLDEAVTAALQIQAVSGGDPAQQAPLIVEPAMEKIIVRGLGLPIGKGYFITDVAFAEGSHPVAIHHEGKDLPATVVKRDTKRGLALLQCPGVGVNAGTFVSRGQAEFGQSIYVASVTLNSTRKSLEPVTLTTGIVGRLIDTTRFQHDAPLVPDAIGGFVLSDRLEVLGVFFSPETRIVGKPAPASGALAPRGITECHRSELLEQMLSGDAQGKRLPGVPELRRGSIAGDKQSAADLLRKGCVLVVSSREIAKTPPAAKTAGGAMPPGAATGWSLSKSGTRHNANCRYFNAGTPCQAADGKACKVCGG